MKKIGLNGFQIKLLMAFLMLLDHLRFIHNFVSPETASFFTLISRCVAPMFGYLAVEGIRHTRDGKRYCLRLWVWAGIMFAGNTILNGVIRAYSQGVSSSEGIKLYLDDHIFFTLALAVLAIVLVQLGREKQGKGKWMYVLSGVCFLVGFLCEWGTVLLPFMFIEYFFREKRAVRFLGYVLIEIIAILLPFGEPFYFLVFPFILLYNGKRGPKTNFTKYFFYVFYCVHLWVIYIINFVVVMGG